MSVTDTGLGTFLETLAREAREADVFANVSVEGERLVCEASESAEQAFYRVEREGNAIWVALVMKDRWLSESIEADLMHSGDKLEELIEEELAEFGVEGERVTFEHYRSDDMLFTFRSKVPVAVDDLAGAAVRAAKAWLLAYEQCFANLGDMTSSDDD